MVFNNKMVFNVTGQDDDDLLGTSSTPSAATIWILIVVCVGLPIALVAWTLWLGHIHYSQRRRRTLAQRQDSVAQGAHTMKEAALDVLKNKDTVLAYFAESGNQMELSKENFKETNKQESDDVDIENPPPPSVGGAGGQLVSITIDKKVGNSRAENDDGNDAGEQHRTVVPDCCAICLDSYKEKDTIVWSDDKNNECPHIFHRDCFVDYLLAHRGNDSPCPMCRQSFCAGPVFELLSPPPQQEEGGSSS